MTAACARIELTDTPTSGTLTYCTLRYLKPTFHLPSSTQSHQSYPIHPFSSSLFTPKAPSKLTYHAANLSTRKLKPSNDRRHYHYHTSNRKAEHDAIN
ncbi:hypothetical protein L873DRAFT_1812957 [Choiromyces venosus 120613-1]|uniref:Uncharacterized protein n=1 Tax=Choiromyces venosus 120613-1 TaxID=1336337 RepID=A0A3N4JAN8_9PEZI|nr:hypothetical protein L873DRAFT_1812957 [Choiromyces venosus 120613-1]